MILRFVDLDHFKKYYENQEHVVINIARQRNVINVDEDCILIYLFRPNLVFQYDLVVY